MQKYSLSPVLYTVSWTSDGFLFSLVSAITCNLPKPPQVPCGLPQASSCGRWHVRPSFCVQAPNTTQGADEDAGASGGSSHGLEGWKQLVSMQHTAPETETAINKYYAEGSGHGFVKFSALGTPVKQNTKNAAQLTEPSGCSTLELRCWGSCLWDISEIPASPRHIVCSNWKGLCK